MLKRPRGRPRTQMHELDKALAKQGGLRSFVTAQYAASASTESIADALFALGKVRVSARTILNWIDYWDRVPAPKESKDEHAGTEED